MAMNVKNIKTTSKFPRPPALDIGAYPSRVVQIIGLGLQKQQAWQGNEKPPAEMVYVTYELLDEFMKDEDGNEIEDKPRWLSEDFALHSLESDLATSTKRYMALDPDMEHGGDFLALGGTPCMVNVVQNPSKKGGDDTIYNNISGVSGMRAKDADKAGPLVNETKLFDFYEPDLDVFSSLPSWLQDKIKDGLNYEGSELEKGLANYKPKDGEAKGKEKKSDEPKGEAKEDGEVDW